MSSKVQRPLSRLLVDVPPPIVDRVAARIGLPPDDVVAMTFKRYRCTGWGNDEALLRNWVQARNSNVCAECLAENGSRWLLPWRATLVCLCPRHGRYLVSRCACGQRLHLTRGDAGQFRFRCGRRASSDQERCGKPVVELSGVPVTDHGLLAVQQRILTLLDDSVDPARRQMAQLMWVTRLVAEFATPELVDDADDLVRAAFASFCRSRDASELSRTSRSLLVAAREDCLTTAALVREAARMVFAASPDEQVARFCTISKPDWSRLGPRTRGCCVGGMNPR